MLKEECVSGTEYFKGAFGISQNIKPDSLNNKISIYLKYTQAVQNLLNFLLELNI